MFGKHKSRDIVYARNLEKFVNFRNVVTLRVVSISRVKDRLVQIARRGTTLYPEKFETVGEINLHRYHSRSSENQLDQTPLTETIAGINRKERGGRMARRRARRWLQQGFERDSLLGRAAFCRSKVRAGLRPVVTQPSVRLSRPVPRATERLLSNERTTLSLGRMIYARQ